jgi:WD40 repeat protein
VWVLGEHRVRHGGSTAFASAVHPEEKYTATAAIGDGTIRFGDIATLRELKTIPVPTAQQIFALKFSSDGKILASSGNDKAIRLWDTATDKQIKVLAEHKHIPVCLAFSRDGKFLASGEQATGGPDGVVIIWDLEKGTKVQQLKLKGQGARTVEFSPDGKTLLTGGNPGDGRVRLWDLATGKDTVVIDIRPDRDRDTTNFINAVFSPDGQEIVTGGSDALVRLFKTADQKVFFKSPPQGTTILSLAYAPDGSTFASGYANGLVNVWIRAEKLVRFGANGCNGSPNALAYYPKAKRLLFTSGDTMQLWDTEARAQIRPTYGHFSVGTTVVFAPNCQYVLSASRDQTARLWEVEINKQVHQVPSIYGMATLSPDGRYILSQWGAEMMTLFDAKENKAIRTFQGEMSAVFTCMAVSPDSRYVAAGGHDHMVRVWDVASGKMVHRILGQQNILRSVLFLPQEGQLLTGAQNADAIRQWDLPSGELRRELYLAGGLTSRLSSSRDGSRLVAGTAKGEIALWDLRDAGKAPKLVRAGHEGAVLGVSLAADAKRFASSGADGKVLLWEAGSNKSTLLAQLPWQVPDVAISPDGNYVAFINTHFTGTVYILRLPKKGG